MNEMDEIREVIATFTGGTTQMMAVSQYIIAYDSFASKAMESLILTTDNFSAQAMAETAWEVADAMMVERRKRGIGGITAPPEVPTPATPPAAEGEST